MSDLDPHETRRRLQRAAEEGASRAAAALGQMVGRELRATTHVIEASPGRPPPPRDDEVVIGFLVDGLEGAGFVVSFPTKTLDAVREMLAPGADAETAPASMVALEVANICTSHFLNSVGDLIEKQLLPSPPGPGEVAVRAHRAEGYVIDVAFETPEGVRFGGAFHFRPGPDLIRALHRSVHLSAARG